jgi:hypothetical protein
MHTQAALQPGQTGSKKLMAQYGEPLVCMRYRDDVTRQQRLTTVEWIAEETPWHPVRGVSKGAEVVGIRVDVQEVSLRNQVNQEGGRWNPTQRLRELRHDQALKLGLKDRIEHKISMRRHPQGSKCISC